MSEEAVLLKRIEKNDHEEIRITRSMFNGKEYIDTRLYFLDEKDGEYKPTKKGLSVVPELFEELVDALVEVRDIA
jgi:hypothetical protein